jgi:hypothetical protein
MSFIDEKELCGSKTEKKSRNKAEILSDQSGKRISVPVPILSSVLADLEYRYTANFMVSSLFASGAAGFDWLNIGS